MEKINHSNMVLRYYIGFEDTEKRVEMLFDFLKNSGIRRVHLFSAPFAETNSILPLEYYRSHAKLLAPIMEKLREMGVEVGINNLYTNGHCLYVGEEEVGFRRAVTIEGTPSRGCICTLQDGFLPYIKELYQTYAALHPSVIFADDDIRMISLGQLTCVCDEHIKKISQRVGREVTAEEVRRCVYEDTFDQSPVREAFFAQLEQDVDFLIDFIADCVHEVSPETEIGIMTTSYPTVTADRDLKKLFERFLPKGVTRIRTGMDYYREGDYHTIPLAFSQPLIQRDFMDNPHVEIQPEIENDTYSFYMKSNIVTQMQIAWCLTNGLRNMQMNLFRFRHPVFNYEGICESFRESMDYHNKLVELIPENHRTRGIGLYLHPKALTKRRDKGGTLFKEATWYKWLGLLGLPISSSIKDAEFLMLTGDDVFLATDEEIDSILGRGAMMDLRAAEALVARGYGDRIGIREIQKMDEPFVGERFTDDELNGIFKNEHNSDYFASTLIDDESVKSISYLESARELSFIINYKKERIAAGVTAYENEAGERFVILPYVDTDFTYFTNVNHIRRHQLINAFEWIGKKALPIGCENEKMCVNINTFPDKNVIALFNLASDDAKTVRLRYQPLGQIKMVTKKGRMRSAKTTYEDGILTVYVGVHSADALVLVDSK